MYCRVKANGGTDVKARDDYNHSAAIAEQTHWKWLFGGFPSATQEPTNGVAMYGVKEDQFREGLDRSLLVADSFVFHGEKLVSHVCRDELDTDMI